MVEGEEIFVASSIGLGFAVQRRSISGVYEFRLLLLIKYNNFTAILFGKYIGTYVNNQLCSYHSYQHSYVLTTGQPRRSTH